MKCFKLLIGLLFLLQFGSSHAQTEKKIQLNYQILDTVKVDGSRDWYKVVWLKDTFELGVQAREDKLFDKMITDPKEELSAEKIAKIRKLESQLNFAQNCYSYAMESYFKQDKKYAQNTFTKKSTINGPGIELLLSNSFEEIREFPCKPRRNLKQELQDHILLAFIDKSNNVSHLVYHNKGVFYSKNGGWKESQEYTLKELVVDNYWDTQKIRLFRFKE